MKDESRTFPWPLFVIIAVLALAAGYGIGISSEGTDQSQMADWNGSRAQAEDAMRRWAAKAGDRSDHVRKMYRPRLMAYPLKNCIQLDPVGYDVGGAPIYCYRANSLDLLEEYSDVE